MHLNTCLPWTSPVQQILSIQLTRYIFKMYILWCIFFAYFSLAHHCCIPMALCHLFNGLPFNFLQYIENRVFGVSCQAVDITAFSQIQTGMKSENTAHCTKYIIMLYLIKVKNSNLYLITVIHKACSELFHEVLPLSPLQWSRNLCLWQCKM